MSEALPGQQLEHERVSQAPVFEVNQQRQKWELPRCFLGQPVRWYRFNRPDNAPFAGYIQRIDRKMKRVVVRVPGHPRNEFQEPCFHVTDPELRKGVHIAEGGCWDFTEDHYLHRNEISNIQERLAAVERKVNESSGNGRTSSQAKKG